MHHGNHREPHRQRGPFWTPITPQTGSFFHAETHKRFALQRDAVDAAVVKIVAWLLDVPDQLLPALHQEQRRRRQRVLLGVAGAALGSRSRWPPLRPWRYTSVVSQTTGLEAAILRVLMSLSALADLKVTEGDGTAAQLLALEGLPTRRAGAPACRRRPRPPYTAPPWPGVSATSSTPLRAHRLLSRSRTVPPYC